MPADLTPVMTNRLARREVLAGAFAVGMAAALPETARAADAVDPGVAAVRRLMALAVQNAFTKLAQPGGFWNSEIARFGLPVLFRRPAGTTSSLSSDAFRSNLQYRLNGLAEAGARGAMPAMVAAAGKLAVPDPAAILKGAPTAGASLLRLETGAGLVNAMIPPLEQAMVVARDPTVAEAMATLPGVTLHDVAHAVALGADNAIWYEVGVAESVIRRNPEQSNDPALVAALRAG